MGNSGISYWERQSFLDTDIAIIGGGVVGMSVAASIKERKPSFEVCVIERSAIPFGASTRNAGFACFGSLSEISADIKIMGPDRARELLFQRWLGLKITLERLKNRDIGFKSYGGYELLNESLVYTLDYRNQINDLVEDFLPNYIQELKPESQPGLKITSNQRLVSMEQEGQLDSGKLIRTLNRYCSEIGVSFYSGLDVREIDSSGKTAAVQTIDSQRSELNLTAQHVVVCANAYANRLIPELDITAGRGQVLITEPIEGLKFEGNLHLDEGYYYLRNVGKRVLFGGGRNMEFENETTYEFGLNSNIQQKLETSLTEILEVSEKPKIDMRWSGIMAFGKDKSPIVRKMDDRLLVATRMNGMGIALAGFIGEETAEILLD